MGYPRTKLQYREASFAEAMAAKEATLTGKFECVEASYPLLNIFIKVSSIVFHLAALSSSSSSCLTSFQPK